MKHCPSCLTEFEDAIENCSDCSAQLEAGPAELPSIAGAELPETSELVSAGSAANGLEADRLKGILLEEGIQHVLLLPRGGASADALSKIAPGWFDIRVLAEERERAAKLIEVARADFAERDPEFEASLRDEALQGALSDEPADAGSGGQTSEALKTSAG